MDNQTVSDSREANECIGTIGPVFLGITPSVQIVIHLIAAMYAHTSTLCHVQSAPGTLRQSRRVRGALERTAGDLYCSMDFGNVLLTLDGK